MKAVILARVSTEMQEDGFSLDAQLDRLRRYCERHNLDIIQEYIKEIRKNIANIRDIFISYFIISTLIYITYSYIEVRRALKMGKNVK